MIKEICSWLPPVLDGRKDCSQEHISLITNSFFSGLMFYWRFNSHCPFVNLILVGYQFLFLTHLFLHPSLLPPLILLIHNSLSVSLPASNLPFSQIVLHVVSLFLFGLPSRIITQTVSPELLCFGFCIVFLHFFVFGTMR